MNGVRINTHPPCPYNDAKIIGEAFRENIPRIMNRGRNVRRRRKAPADPPASGLAFALEVCIERVTAKVFLGDPSNLEVLGGLTLRGSRRLRDRRRIPPSTRAKDR